MNCKYCGAITYPTDHFCSVCGKPVIPEGNNQVTSNQYSNTTQFNNTNVSPNINSFDNYNYNPSRYKPQVNANEVSKAHQIAFANSIAISLLAVMLIIFIIISLIYFGTDNTEANTVGGTNTSGQPGYYTPPVHPNNTTTNTTAKTNSTKTNTTSTYYGKTRTDTIYTKDYYTAVSYEVPNTYTDYPDNYDQHKGYVDSAETHMVSVMMYPRSESKVISAFTTNGYTIVKQSTYFTNSVVFTLVETVKDQERCDYYLYEIDSDNTFAIAVQPAYMISSEDLSNFLNIDIY